MYKYNRTIVYTVDILDLANFLESKGRKGAINRWNDIKQHNTDHGYIMKQGFTFEFDYNYQKKHENLDEETLKDMFFIQKELNVLDESVLFLKIKSDYILHNELKIIENFTMKPNLEVMYFINVIYLMNDLDTKRNGFKQRWEQIIGWHSMNFSNYSMIYFDFDIEDFKKQNNEFLLDALLFQKEYELKDKEKIAFQVNW